MSEGSLALYEQFNGLIKTIREKSSSELKNDIPSIVEQLIKRYTELQKNFSGDSTCSVLPDYDDQTGRLISLKTNGVKICNSKTGEIIKLATIPEYFGEVLEKIEQKAKSDRYQGMDVELKYDFLDKTYRTLLMWEGHFKREEMKEGVFNFINTRVQQKCPPTLQEIIKLCNDTYGKTPTEDISYILKELMWSNKVILHSLKPLTYEIKGKE